MADLSGKTILVIAGHPDDPDFGCGATVAKYIQAGATAYYLVCTNGARGSRDQQISGEDLVVKRQEEQKNAANIIGVKEVFFLDHPDGELEEDILLKEEIVKYIRRLKPDMVFTHDPSWTYRIDDDGFAFINHSDHRKTGSAAIDAIYPLARDLSSFPNHKEEGLTPHKVQEILLFHVDNPNFTEDVSDFFDVKYRALLEHISQIDDPGKLKETLENRMGKLGREKGVKFAEGFIKLRLR